MRPAAPDQPVIGVRLEPRTDAGGRRALVVAYTPSPPTDYHDGDVFDFEVQDSSGEPLVHVKEPIEHWVVVERCGQQCAQTRLERSP